MDKKRRNHKTNSQQLEILLELFRKNKNWLTPAKKTSSGEDIFKITCEELNNDVFKGAKKTVEEWKRVSANIGKTSV